MLINRYDDKLIELLMWYTNIQKMQIVTLLILGYLLSP